MKSLSLTTFFLFVFCLCLRGYSYYTFSKLKSKVTTSTSLLDDNKKKSIALLNTLDVISKPKTKRKPASKENGYVSQRDYLVVTFINDFFEPINNLTSLKSLQEKIKKDNLKINAANNALETLPIKLIFYLVIKENFDLSELKKTSPKSIYGFDDEQLTEMRIKAKSSEFMREILDFKNVPTEEIDSNIETIETIARLEKKNKELNKDKEVEANEFVDQLPEEVKEQIHLAENEEVDLEEKLLEMEYTEEEIEEIIEGYQY